MKKKQWVGLLLILALGIFFRFWQLGKTPKGFYLDEAALGYNAFSLMTTGKDEFGMSWPVLFRSFGDFKAPVYTYLLILVYKFLGMSVWSTRLLSAISGVGILWFGFWIIKKLSNNIRLSLIATLLMAISPWLIIFSRTSYETNLALLFMMIMIWSFYKSKGNKKWLILTAIMAGLAFLSYHSERVITPLVLLGLILNQKKDIFNKKNMGIIAVSVAIGLGIVLPTVKLMTTPGFLSRLNSLSILSDKVKTPWGFDQDLIGWQKVVFNNPVELKLREFASLYTSYFSPRYLFGLGDPGPRSSYVDLAPFLVWQLPFGIVGLIWLWKKNKTKEEKELQFLIVLMMAVSPIPAAITRDPFSSIRALPLAWPLIILISIGVNELIKKFNKIGWLILAGLIVWSWGKIYLPIFKFNDYFRGSYWEAGIAEMVEKIENQNLPVVVDNTRGEIYSQILFFTQANAKKYQEENFEVDENNYYVDMKRDKTKKIGKIEVRPIVWEDDVYEKKIIVGDSLSISDEQLNEHCLTLVFEIKDTEGKVIFRGAETHPQDKVKFNMGDKVNGFLTKKCPITWP